MLSKYFALFAAFAAFTPAFAAPVPETLVDAVVAVTNDVNNLNVNALTKRADAVNSGLFDEVIKRLEFTERDSGCGLADVDVIVSNVLNNVTINILKRDDCDVVGVTAAAVDILNNLNVNVLTKREVTSSQVASAVQAAAQNQGITLASRSDLDDAAAVNEILRRYEGIAARAKGSPYSQAQIVDAIMQAMQAYGGSSSRRRGTTPDVRAVTEDLLSKVYGTKRANVISAQVFENDPNTAKGNVISGH
ncbi:uncharacterized protein F5891DRAFT_1196169 [Suillus fuscotomentosus]|uniref:Uncharacterized protein n=1 Tax=Suillus fuscotomentosus TaxID=1912939 RepID=A0AAD4HEH2_9AGAM|nr:uncharacterized protein F5891DRAFT_1196169 [Suillus fuscotomentosus]KAG1893638.1 hypothetical protein F5891DRAFT_1196169 [Suillus fuscotomentosus]